MRRWLLIMLALLARPAMAQLAQAPGAQEAGAPLDPQAVYVVTMGQGDQIWERFGHNFLAVPDPQSGLHIAYNWGVFDFAAPDFLSRFLLGDTRYWMEGNELGAVLRVYRQYNRTITLQRLALTSDQVGELREFLRWNALPENRYYRYDYFRDNCSTRLRDALDRALGGALRRATEPALTNLTYRSESIRLTDEAPAAQLGIDIALGQPADALLSQWEAMFIPMRLQEYIRDVRVQDPSGVARPLVAEERVVFEAQRAPELTRAPGLMGEGAAAGIGGAAVLALLGWFAATRRGASRAALGLVGALWGGVAGSIGVVLLLAWLATQHAYWYRNENLLQFNPLALALLVLVPLALRAPRWWPAARILAIGVAAISSLGAVLKFMPWMMQDNWPVIAFALPIHVALAWAVARVSRGDSGAARPELRPGELRRARRLSERAVS